MTNQWWQWLSSARILNRATGRIKPLDHFCAGNTTFWSRLHAQQVAGSSFRDSHCPYIKSAFARLIRPAHPQWLPRYLRTNGPLFNREFTLVDLPFLCCKASMRSGRMHYYGSMRGKTRTFSANEFPVRVASLIHLGRTRVPATIKLFMDRNKRQHHVDHLIVDRVICEWVSNRFGRSWAFRTAPAAKARSVQRISFPHRPSARSVAATPVRSPTVRGFHCGSPNRIPPIVFMPVLKATTMLKGTATITRILLSLFPLSLRSHVKHLRGGKLGSFFSSRSFLVSLLLLPVVLLWSTLALHTHRTPVTGRWRIVLLDKEDEADIMRQMVSETSVGRLDVPQEIHWYHILRKALREQDAQPGVLFGSPVLLEDWRVHWLKYALGHLEQTLPSVSDARQLKDLSIPASASPLSVVANAAPTANYTVLLIDNPEKNAMAFGWPPDAELPDGLDKKGVVCVYTGLLDSILGKGSSEPRPVAPQQNRQLSVVLAHELAHLALGHPLEASANSSLLWPQIRMLGIDVVRTILWPVTALLGPFVNDSIFASSSQGTTAFDLASACESRKLELEADSVSLRLLAAANIDPQEAAVFWERRLAMDGAEARSAHPPMTQHASHDGGSKWLARHPMTEERLQGIQRVLQGWRV